MDWSQAVDIYCERTSTAFWAEPVNAISNAAFVAAALWAAVEATRRGVTSRIVWVLIVLAGLIGIGSFLFHTFATVWSGFFDTVPIWAFVATFILVGMHRIGGMAPGKIGGIVALILVALVVMFVATGDGSGGEAVRSPDRLNGSGQYAPALVALFLFAALSWWRNHPFRNWVVAAAAVFFVSLVFRTLDMQVCAAFPIGTHFIWHVLNALMIALLLQMIVRIPAKAA